MSILVSEALREIYTINNTVLVNHDIMQRMLMDYYSKHDDDYYKKDYNLINIASGSGLGRTLYSKFVSQSSWPDDSDKIEIASELQRVTESTKNKLSIADAERAVSFFCYMLGWENPPYEQPKPVTPPQPVIPTPPDIPPQPVIPTPPDIPPQPVPPDDDQIQPVIPPEQVDPHQRVLPLQPDKTKAAMSPFRKWSILHFILSVVYIGVFVALLEPARLDTSADPFSMIGNGLGVLLAYQLVTPTMILNAFGLIFSLVGIIIKKRWAFLTSAIIDTVGLFPGIALFAAMPAILIIAIPLVIVGYITFNKGKSA